MTNQTDDDFALMVERDESIFIIGLRAAIRGSDYESNPYTGDDGFDWSRGFFQGKEQLKWAVGNENRI